MLRRSISRHLGPASALSALTAVLPLLAGCAGNTADGTEPLRTTSEDYLVGSPVGPPIGKPLPPIGTPIQFPIEPTGCASPLPVTDLGEPGFRVYADVNGDFAADYCRFVGNPPDVFLSCQLGCPISHNYGYPYGFNSIQGIDQGSSPQLMRDINNDGTADFCRMLGPAGSQYVSCNLATVGGFDSNPSDVTLPPNTPMYTVGIGGLQAGFPIPGVPFTPLADVPFIVNLTLTNNLPFEAPGNIEVNLTPYEGGTTVTAYGTGVTLPANQTVTLPVTITAPTYGQYVLTGGLQVNDGNHGYVVGAVSPEQIITVPYPAYNRVYGIATHNSYWINRSDQQDFFASGTQELLSDQLLHEHVRAIELDAHAEGAPAGQWAVYHTSAHEDFSCRYLSDCIKYLQNWQYAIPDHEVFNIIVELKNSSPVYGTPGSNFNATHTMDQFDAQFRDALGTSLYQPADFFARCPGETTLTACAKVAGWPTTDQLRGKFIVNVIGNWSVAGADWAAYATSGIQQRAAFPLQSVLELNDVSPTLPCPADADGASLASNSFPVTMDGTTLCIKSGTNINYDGVILGQSPYYPVSQRQEAFAQSIFWQLEDIKPSNTDQSAALQQFLADNGVVRGGDSFEYSPDCQNDGDDNAGGQDNCQEWRIWNGIQLVQTDDPWHFVNNGGPGSLPTDPSQRLKEFTSLPGQNGAIAPHGTIYEPGNRLYFQTTATYPGVWAYANQAPVSARWLETTVSSTRHGAPYGVNSANLLPWVIAEIGSFGIGIVLVGAPTPIFPPNSTDYVETCPGFQNPEGSMTANACTDYARPAQEDGEGCIKVMDAAEANGIEICRQKNTTSGASDVQESVDVYVRVFRAGQSIQSAEWVAGRYAPCKTDNDPNSGDVSSTCVGSMLGMAIANSGTGAQVTVYSAGQLNANGTPDWNALQTAAFTSPLVKQGFRGWKSELLAGVRTGESLVAVGTNDWRPEDLHGITLADLPAGESADNFSDVVDLSH
jgi:Phosphoinositide phospholipase C, Ca2+-dependent